MNYVHRLRSCCWPVACLCSFLLLACTVEQIGMPGLEEYTALRREALRQQEELQRLQSFALQYGNYEAYLADKTQELADLKGRLQGTGDVNAVQSAAQRLALANGVALLEASADAAAKINNGAKQERTVQRLRLQAEGDYYAVLRWLRQLERQPLALDELRLQGEESSGRVRAEILLKLYGFGNI